MSVYINIYIHMFPKQERKCFAFAGFQRSNFSVEKETERLHECSRLTFRQKKYWVLMDSSGANLGSLNCKKKKR